jgi:hypothetical protein
MKTWRLLSLADGAALIGLAMIATSAPGPSRAQAMLPGL